MRAQKNHRVLTATQETAVPGMRFDCRIYCDRGYPTLGYFPITGYGQWMIGQAACGV
jgi:hypothetical protein